MDTKSKILNVIILLAVIMSVAITYHKTIREKDFEMLESETEEESVLDEAQESSLDQADTEETDISEVESEVSAEE